MKKVMNVVLGIVTSIGGFVEVGSISTAAQAGAAFGLKLLWAIAVAVVCIAVLCEMSGRLAAVSRHTVSGAVREHLGIKLFLVPLTAEILLDLLVLAAELGGIGVAFKLATGWGIRWWVLPAALLVWLVLWLGTFSIVEDGVGILGLVTLCFVVAAARLHPDGARLAAGFIPSLPGHHLAQYAFLAVSIAGATISPYLVNFYASGAVEEEWTEKDLTINRITAVLGMGFGSVVAMGVLVSAALVLHPRGIQVDSYEQAALMLVPVFGHWGVRLFAASLAIGCFGAAVEVALNLGYLLSQGLGWNWGENKKPREAARFSLAFTIVIAVSALVMLTGIDPLSLTMVAMTLTVIVIPVLVLPFLVIMNDTHYLKDHTNGRAGNFFVAGLTVLGALLALVVVPLQLLGG